METRSFDWSLVRSFLAVLDAGSVMGAARRIGAQQPTLSRHLAELEAQLGVPLFERTGRGVSPTAAALAIAAAARQMQEGADVLGRALAGQRDATAGTVRITTSDVAAVWLLPEVLAALQAEEPGIAIELVASNGLTNLLRREADIAVRMVRPAQSSLIARKLGDVAITAAAHEAYLARAGTPGTPADLLQHRLIGYDRDDLILRGFAAMGVAVTREQFVLRTDDQVAYGRLVAAGAGIGFVAAYNVPLWPGVRTLLPMLTIPPLPCWLAVHREIRGNRVVRRVYDFLAEALPRLLAG
jgi:DNA-binding transcriptional LysR family regulator